LVIFVLGDWVSILIKLGGLTTLRRVTCCYLLGRSDNSRTGLLKVQVICEEVALFSVNNRLDNFFSVISEFRQDLNNNVHNDGAKTWEPQKDFINDLTGKGL
jgi:hypothetical protein